MANSEQGPTADLKLIDLLGKELGSKRFLWISELALPRNRRRPPDEGESWAVREAWSFVCPEPVHMCVLLSLEEDVRALEAIRTEALTLLDPGMHKAIQRVRPVYALVFEDNALAINIGGIDSRRLASGEQIQPACRLLTIGAIERLTIDAFRKALLLDKSWSTTPSN